MYGDISLWQYAVTTNQWQCVGMYHVFISQQSCITMLSCRGVAWFSGVQTLVLDLVQDSGLIALVIIVIVIIVTAIVIIIILCLHTTGWFATGSQPPAEVCP